MDAGQMEVGRVYSGQVEAGQVEAGKPGDWHFSPKSALFPQISRDFSTVSWLNAGQVKPMLAWLGKTQPVASSEPWAAGTLARG